MSALQTLVRRRHLNAKGSGEPTVTFSLAEAQKLISSLELLDTMPAEVAARTQEVEARVTQQLRTTVKDAIEDALMTTRMLRPSDRAAALATQHIAVLRRMAVATGLADLAQLQVLLNNLQAAETAIEPAPVKETSAVPFAEEVRLNSVAALSTRCKNALGQEGIYTLADLLPYSEQKLLRLPRMGQGSVKLVKAWLQSRGFQLSMTPPAAIS